MKDKKMLKLKTSFQKKLFEDLLSKYNSSFRAGEILGIPASSVRGYKNLFFKTISEDLINKIISLKLIDSKMLKENLLETKKKSEIVKNSLDKGRTATKDKFKKIKEKIPSIDEIVCNKTLDFSKWFERYLPLTNFGFRKIKIKEHKKHIKVRYSNFTKKGFKIFNKKLPKKYFLDNEFSYFFGLWCGDRSGGKRFGIINQNKEILEFSQKFLQKNFQEVEKILYCSQNSIIPEIPYNKKAVINKKASGWAISLHSTNGILSSFFYYLLENLDYLLENHLNSHAFFAGLFDAEGNVSLYNKSFRWACKDNDLIKVYSKHLKKISLYKKYDGVCLIAYNKESFLEKIFPHLKHNKKISDALFLCNGNKQSIPLIHRKIISFLRKEPLSSQKDIAKALKKSKVYSELSLLKEFGFVIPEGYPPRFKLNKEIKNISGD